MPKPWNKLIVALDITSERKIKRVIARLSPKVKKFKIGLVAYTRFGPRIIKEVKESKAQVFLDFKLFDIPNTMIETAKSFLNLGVWAFTVHLRSGQEALQILTREIKKEARRRKKKAPLIIGVSELTSQKASLTEVLNLAKVAKGAKIDGVVCSVWEAKKIKQRFGLLTITPGIRIDRKKDDQRRIATVRDALKNKVDYFVIGRPIVKKRDCLKAAEQILTD